MERILHDKISSWVRLARYRARRHGCISRLDLHAVITLVEENGNKCAYCLDNCHSLDNAFPLSDNAPNVLANTIPVCRNCKRLKGQRDLVSYHENGHISNQRYLEVLRSMLSRDGSEEVRDHLKSVTGIGIDDKPL